MPLYSSCSEGKAGRLTYGKSIPKRDALLILPTIDRPYRDLHARRN
jgi:hypothetical protein